MKRLDAYVSANRSQDSREKNDTISNRQAAESLHEISVNTPTLRDQFAMSALQGLLANQGLYIEPDELSRRAYRLADAMLEARK